MWRCEICSSDRTQENSRVLCEQGNELTGSKQMEHLLSSQSTVRL